MRVNRKYYWLALNALFLSLYVGAPRLVYLLSEGVVPAPAWLPTGIAVGAMVALGPRLWPVPVFGVILNILIGFPQRVTGWLLFFGVIVSVGNFFEAFLATKLIRRFVPNQNPILQAKHLIHFLVFGAVLPPALGATIGVGSGFLLNMYPTRTFTDVWLAWWLENLNGVVLIGPLVVMSVYGMKPLRSAREIVEGTLLFCAVVLIAGLLFGTRFGIVLSEYRLEYLCLPLLLWAASDSESKGCA